MAKKNKDKNSKNWIFYLILGGFIIELIRLIKGRKKNDFRGKLKDLEKEEIKEINRYKNGKEPLLKWAANSCRLLKDLFIPHEDNNHKPKILRAKSLLGIALLLLVLKFTLVSYLFVSFPQGARLSEVVITKVLELINSDRLKDNLGQLTLNPILSASALKKAEDMIAKDYFAHHTPEGLKPWDFINRDLYPYTLVGENLAINFTTADSVHNALMNSESHKKNILNSNYNEIGIAMVNGMLNNQNTNVLVELFATRGATKLAVADAEENMDTVTAEESKEIAINENNISALGEESEVQEVLNKENENTEPTEEKAAAGAENASMEIAEKEAAGELSLKRGGGAAAREDNLIIEKEHSPAMTQASPNLELENPSNFQVLKVKSTDQDGIVFTASMINVFNIILITVLSIITIALFINIIIRIKIQHKHVIIQSILFLIFTGGLLYLKFHYLESALAYILII